MTDAQPLTLDDVLTGGSNVEKQIDQMIFEKIDLVYVKKAAMRPGE